MRSLTIVLPVLALMFCIASCDASAANDTPAPAETATAKYDQFFLVGGKQVDAATAIVQSLNGREAFKCTSVVAKVSASGTSIGVKNVKKPRKN